MHDFSNNRWNIFFSLVKGIHEDKSHWTIELPQIKLVGQSPQFLIFIWMLNAIHPFMINARMRDYIVI